MILDLPTVSSVERAASCFSTTSFAERSDGSVTSAALRTAWALRGTSRR